MRMSDIARDCWQMRKSACTEGPWRPPDSRLQVLRDFLLVSMPSPRQQSNSMNFGFLSNCPFCWKSACRSETATPFLSTPHTQSQPPCPLYTKATPSEGCETIVSKNSSMQFINSSALRFSFIVVLNPIFLKAACMPSMSLILP